MNNLHIRFQSAKSCFLIVIIFLSVLMSGRNASAQAAPVGENIFTASAGLPSAQTVTVNLPSAGWPMQGHDMQRTGKGSVAGPLSSNLKWTYDFMDPVWHDNVTLQDNASPIVGSDGTIYQITDLDGVYAIKPDGSLKWYKSGEAGFSYGGRSAPALSPDHQVLYLTARASSGPAVVALNAQSGSKIWSYLLGDFGAHVSYSSLTVDNNGVIYIGSTLPASLFAINPNGSLKWSYAPPNPDLIGIEAAPAVAANGNVYVVINTIGLVAIDANGNLLWTSNDIVGDYGWPTPTIGPDGTIYIFQGRDTSQEFYAINPNGTVKWVREGIGNAHFLKGAALSADGRTVYIAADGKVYALNTTTGATRWVSQIASIDEKFGGSIALSSNNILYIPGYISSSDHVHEYIYAVSARNGALVWTYQLNSLPRYWSPQSPAIGPNGTLYAVASGEPAAWDNIPARLYAFGPPASCPAITVNPDSLPNAQVGSSYDQTLTATGSSGAYTFVLTGGNLPSGLRLTNAGNISGVPNIAGTYPFTVSAVDSNGCTGSRAYEIGVSAPPGAFAKSSPTNGATNQSNNPTLMWNPSARATSYEYCYDTTNDNACSNWINNGASASKTLSGLSYSTTYYWHVRAVNNAGTKYANNSPTAFWSFTTQGTPTRKTLTATVDDGWVLELTETSNQGGTMNATTATFNVGDAAGDKQYRSIISFNTASLPDNAVITAVTFRIMRQGVAGTNPFSTHGNLMMDIIKGAFGGSNALQLADFQAAASKSGMVIPNKPSAGWYAKALPANALTLINKVGVTQIRLRFTLDDNDDLAADYIKFYSGNAPLANRPRLIIQYYIP